MKRYVAAGLGLALAVAGSIGLVGPNGSRAAGCPAGYHSLALESSRDATLWQHAHPRATTARYAGLCVSDSHPEPFDEVAAGTAQRDAMLSAPYGSVLPGAYAAAARQARALSAGRAAVPESSRENQSPIRARSSEGEEVTMGGDGRVEAKRLP